MEYGNKYESNIYCTVATVNCISNYIYYISYNTVFLRITQPI